MSDPKSASILRAVPLYYNTYNERYANLAILIFVIFIFGISILYVILQYELFNRQSYCDPRFYYGKACNTVISKSILMDPTFLKKKKEFYDSANKVTADLVKDSKTIDEDKSTINGANELSSPKFIEESAKDVDSITKQLDVIKTGYLGNPNVKLKESISQLNDSFLKQLKGLPEELEKIKDMFTDGVILPSSARLIDALQKLHKSVNDPAWTVPP